MEVGCQTRFHFFIQKLFQMRNLIFGCVFLLPVFLFGQVKHDYFWLLGREGESSAPEITIFDFNTGYLDVSNDFMRGHFFLTSSSLSNKAGELQFYSDGCKIYNKLGEVMENGSGLNPGVAYDTGNCPDLGNTVPKGLLILPLPGSDNLYYVFHKSNIWGDGSPFLIIDGILYLSIVDMSIGNGIGAVTVKNDTILSDTLYSDLHAVKHANGMDWWIMTSKENGNRFFTVLLSSDGIAGVFEQDIGPAADPNSYGVLCFSPDGNKLARYDETNQLLLYDFDRETGQLSNLRQLMADTSDVGWWGSVSFSPSSRFLYVSSLERLYQFDLYSPDIQGSRVLVDEYDGYLYLGLTSTNFGLMQLAPDCKIYMSTPSSSQSLHVIHSPDSPGLACDFEQRGIDLPAINTASIPNFPNYRLGTLHPVCDSTIQLVVSSVQVLPQRQEIMVYPNPARGQITVELPKLLDMKCEWVLYSGVGQQVMSRKMGRGITRMDISLIGLSQGLYFWQMTSDRKRIDGGKLVISE